MRDDENRMNMFFVDKIPFIDNIQERIMVS